MDLKNYIKTKSKDLSAAAKELGVSTIALKHWIYGERIPRPEAMKRIVSWTEGKVTPNDFYANDNNPKGPDAA